MKVGTEVVHDPCVPSSHFHQKWCQILLSQCYHPAGIGDDMVPPFFNSLGEDGTYIPRFAVIF